MEGEKKLDTLEEELKLMKGELKQSLASVRDYLLNMELPSSEFSTILAALGDGSDQKITMRGNFTNDKDRDKPLEEDVAEPSADASQEEALESESETPEGEEELNPEEAFESASEMLPEDGLTDQGGSLEGENLEGENPEGEELGAEGEPLSELDSSLEEPEGEIEDPDVPESQMPAEEEEQMAYAKLNTEIDRSVPKVNLIANLMNWVARAKKEIGYEQIPIFLDVYGISGHLSPEMKEMVLHLADITADQPEDVSTAELWSQSMLSLHGILTGGDVPLYAVKPPWNDNGKDKPEADKVSAPEPVKSKSAPVKLKLVFPNGDGKEKEFCLDLTPEDKEERPG